LKEAKPAMFYTRMNTALNGTWKRFKKAIVKPVSMIALNNLKD